jgi:hypothetical protein
MAHNGHDQRARPVTLGYRQINEVKPCQPPLRRRASYFNRRNRNALGRFASW